MPSLEESIHSCADFIATGYTLDNSKGDRHGIILKKEWTNA
jgi:hypothetical protein